MGGGKCDAALQNARRIPSPAREKEERPALARGTRGGFASFSAPSPHFFKTTVFMPGWKRPTMRNTDANPSKTRTYNALEIPEKRGGGVRFGPAAGVEEGRF
jgi:hypothetical protein